MGPSSASFGTALSLAGDRLLVGDFRNDEMAEDNGVAYLFDVQTGAELAKFALPYAKARREFGTDVVLSDRYALIGATGYASNPAAYLYDAVSGARMAMLSCDKSSWIQSCGDQVALSGDRAVVAAPRESGTRDRVTKQGAIYVFDAATGERLMKLAPEYRPNFFGSAMAASDKYIVASGMAEFDEGTQGAAYVFDAQTGAQLHVLTDGRTDNWDSFGVEVAVSDKYVVVGSGWLDKSWSADDRGRELYIYDAESGELLHLVDLQSRAGTPNMRIDIEGDTIVIGRWPDDNVLLVDAKSGELTPFDTAGVVGNPRAFGAVVSISDDRIAVFGENPERPGQYGTFIFRDVEGAVSLSTDVLDGPRSPIVEMMLDLMQPETVSASYVARTSSAVAPVPLPGSAGFVVAGGLALAVWRRRRAGPRQS